MLSRGVVITDGRVFAEGCADRYNLAGQCKEVVVDGIAAFGVVEVIEGGGFAERNEVGFPGEVVD